MSKKLGLEDLIGEDDCLVCYDRNTKDLDEAIKRFNERVFAELSLLKQSIANLGCCEHDFKKSATWEEKE